jgi:predicted metal-dependent phosphoesterase TrpH
VDRTGLADLHLHTLASDGMMSATALVDYAESRTELDLIAITDHDEVGAALAAREYAASRGFRVQVVCGVEVTTRDGHLLALFIEERPPALQPMLDTAEWVLNRGGLCIAPHPFTRLTFSLPTRVMGQAADRGLLAGVEVLNASPAGRRSRAAALRFATDRQLTHVGGSDAHMMGVVGLAHTSFAGRTPEELRDAIESGATSAEGRFARVGEIAAEALPQLGRSLVQLPLRRLQRFGPALAARLGTGGSAEAAPP